MSDRTKACRARDLAFMVAGVLEEAQQDEGRQLNAFEIQALLLGLLASCGVPVDVEEERSADL